MTTMNEFTLMALRAMANNQGASGKAIAVQGICDMVEEYLGVHREIFHKEIVKSNSILDGALLMWQKKQKKVAIQYFNEFASYEDITEMDTYFVEMYYLYPTTLIKSLNDHMNKMTYITDLAQAIEAEEQAYLEAEIQYEIETRWSDE